MLKASSRLGIIWL